MTVPRSDVVNWNEIDGTPGNPDWSQGPAGPAGPPGPQGPIGPPGEDGQEGIQGDQGIPGAGWKVMQVSPTDGSNTGDPLGTIWYNSVTGQFWTLINTTPYTWRLDGTVVGAQGNTGPQGPAGAQGPPGATGNTGPAGPQGVQGVPGPQGIQGPVGPQGATGNTGATGTQGATGAQGPVGPGVAAGGATGTILTKASATDYATQWSTSLGTTQITDGAITSAKIADGTIVGPDLADAAVPNVKLSADTARANLCTNGGFEIWQRGLGPFTTNNAYTADRWQMQFGGGATMSVSQAGAPNFTGGFNGIGCTVNTGGGYANLQQKTETYFFTSYQKTFAIYAKTTLPNGAQAFIATDGTNTLGTSHTGSGNWERLTVTVPSGGSSVVVGVIFTGNGTIYLDSAMLVVGSVAADYALLHPADDLARCLRYYEVFGGSGNWFIRGHASDTNAYSFAPLIYSVRKPVVPTVTKVGTWTVTNCGQPIFDQPTLTNCRMFVNPTATGVFQWVDVGAATYVSVEANP